jgi:nucleosome assembly protein 1-like 1
VSWFIGEVVQGDEFEDTGDDDEDDDDNEGDEDEEDEEDDEDEEGKSRKKVHISSRFSLILYYLSY